MATGAFKVTIDASAVVRLAGKLDALSPENINEAAVEAVNRTADNVYDLAVPRMVAVVNLTDNYVRNRMEVKHAVTRAQAQIVAAKDSAHETMLSRYGADQKVRRVNWTNDMIESMGHKFGKWPGWTQRIGDRSREIDEDEKAAGVSVEVLRGVAKTMPGAFLLSLRGGSDVAVATHPKGGGKQYRVRYGPAVYQLFRNTAVKMVDESTDMLEMTLVSTVNKFMDEALQ